MKPYFTKSSWIAQILSLLVTSASPVMAAPTVTDIDPWTNSVTGESLARQAILPEGADTGVNLATVVYLKNLASPRVGTDSDADIIDSFLAEGMLVVTVDFASHPQARVPFLNQDIVQIRQDLHNGLYVLPTTGYKLDRNHIFLVPEGCRLRRNVHFRTEQSTSSQRKMDIIYPANPLIPVGALIEVAYENNNRMENGNLANFHDSIVSAQASEGFATALADHPMAGGYIGIDNMPECALSVRAAVRTLRSMSEELGLNGRIATMGFSRGSGVALMAVTTRDVTQWRFYVNQSSFITFPDSQFTASDPVPTGDPSVQGAIILSGRFTYVDLLENDPNLNLYTQQWNTIESNYDRWEYMGALDFLEADPGYPLFLSLNANEDEHPHHQMDVLKQRLTSFGGEYIYFEDSEEPIGHRVPITIDIMNGINRYLRSVLMDPNPEALVQSIRFTSQYQPASQSVLWTASGTFPPMDYGFSISEDLINWSSDETIRPDDQGHISFDAELPRQASGFLRLTTPPNPLP